MRWLPWALLRVLWGVLWGAPWRVSGCVLCSPAAAEALGAVLGPFLTRSMPHTPAMRARVATIMLRGVLGLSRLPQHPDTFMGVIDEATLDEAAAQFRRTLARLVEQNVQDQQLYTELHWALQEVKDDFERLMRRFQKRGRMEVVWIECVSCNITLFACNRGVQCGERSLRVVEGDELLLDCGLSWHRASHGTKSYRFYRVPGPGAAAPPAEQLLSSGPDPLLLRKEAAAAAAGRYRCEMRNPRGELGSELRFNVTVTPRPRPLWHSPAPLAPPGFIRVLPVVAAAASVAVVAAGTAALWCCLRLRPLRGGSAPSRE
ncbi:izumo sperm-egg fusion protein 1 isoform X2 [Strigops habroptila]|uniref:izumo sperm-egg fusion protein 1 isoform X2 n=1 Tax=Strigops habroptila TaxID=2489341 RepID=UPI0011CF6C5A|nr:izumo sperm-egg fusion protein 1 isoform X2 [Strigops habroptila]